MVDEARLPGLENKQSVFVIDDDPVVLNSVCSLVGSMGIQAASFLSAEDFLAGFDPKSSGCVIVDQRLGSMTGLDLVEKMAAMKWPIPAILLTAYADVPLAVRAIRLGAVSVLEKPCKHEVLCDAIHVALEEDRRQVAKRRREIEVQDRLARLSSEEKQVLDLVVAGKANKNIATHLDLGLRTVEKRRARVFEKMEVESLSELIRLVASMYDDEQIDRISRHL